MSNSITVQGSDTIKVGSRTLSDFADGDVANLEFPQDMINMKTCYDGNTIVAYNHSGKHSTLKVRVLRASADDIALNNYIIQSYAAFSATPPITGKIVKKLGTGTASSSTSTPSYNDIAATDTYDLYNGVITKLPGSKTNTEGALDQAVTEYEIKFGSSLRTLVAGSSTTPPTP